MEYDSYDYHYLDVTSAMDWSCCKIYRTPWIFPANFPLLLGSPKTVPCLNTEMFRAIWQSLTSNEPPASRLKKLHCQKGPPSSLQRCQCGGKAAVILRMKPENLQDSMISMILHGYPLCIWGLVKNLEPIFGRKLGDLQRSDSYTLEDPSGTLHALVRDFQLIGYN